MNIYNKNVVSDVTFTAKQGFAPHQGNLFRQIHIHKCSGKVRSFHRWQASFGWSRHNSIAGKNITSEPSMLICILYLFRIAYITGLVNEF